jgi:hypothetical protein
MGSFHGPGGILLVLESFFFGTVPNFYYNDHEQKYCDKGEQVENMKSHGDEKGV